MSFAHSGGDITEADLRAFALQAQAQLDALALAGTPSAADTVTGPADYGDSSAAGTSDDYSRADHDHGLPDAPAGLTVLGPFTIGYATLSESWNTPTVLTEIPANVLILDQAVIPIINWESGGSPNVVDLAIAPIADLTDSSSLGTSYALAIVASTGAKFQAAVKAGSKVKTTSAQKLIAVGTIDTGPATAGSAEVYVTVFYL